MDLKKLKGLSKKDLICEILECDREISKALTHPNYEIYPEYIDKLGDIYIDRFILEEELRRRKSV